MEAQSTDRKTFQLMENGPQLGELIYENLFFIHAQLRLQNAKVYDIKPVGFFGTSISVSENGIEIVNLKMNWRGQIVFTFEDEREFVLKAKGTFLNNFILEDEKGEKLFQLNPKFNWSKFHYNYDIAFEKYPEDILLVLLGIYAANYFVASMTGATSGMA